MFYCVLIPCLNPYRLFYSKRGMTILISILGFLVSLSSMVVTFMRGHHKEKGVSIYDP